MTVYGRVDHSHKPSPAAAGGESEDDFFHFVFYLMCNLEYIASFYQTDHDILYLQEATRCFKLHICQTESGLTALMSFYRM